MRNIAVIRSQKGFTMIELLIAFVISGILGTAIIFSMSNTLNFSSSNNNLNVAINNVSYAAESLSKDIRGAKSTTSSSGNLTPTSGETLDLSWFDIENIPHSSSFTVTGEGALQRTFDGTPTTIATYISQISYTVDNKTVTLNITATVETKGYTKQYIVLLRN